MSPVDVLCRWFDQWGTAFREVLFPSVCLLCLEPLDVDQGETEFCSHCEPERSRFRRALCGRCAHPLPPHWQAASQCGFCARRDYAFAAAIAYGPYDDSLRQAVILAKQAHHEPLASALGRRLADVVLKTWPEPSFDLIVPMPMHWWRRWLRGVNNVERIAEEVAKACRVPLRSRLLRVRKVTAKQGTLSPAARFRNVRGAFAVHHGQRIVNMRVLLVDDVLTTGATASEVARVLRRAGAAEVRVAVVARGLGASPV